jgi:hypothetical protein
MKNIIYKIGELIVGIICIPLFLYSGMYSQMAVLALGDLIGPLVLPLLILSALGPFILPCLLIGLLCGIARLLRL